MVVIYYDAPPPETMAMIKEWAGLYVGPWSGVVVTPAPGLGEEVVLTAPDISMIGGQARTGS